MNQGLPPIAIEDRYEIEDLLGRYFWAVDTADVEGVIAVFAPGAIVRYGSGERYEGAEGIRRFALRAIGGEEARGRMHFNRPLFAERKGECVVLRSYLISTQWKVGEEPIAIGTMRHTEDSFIRTEAGWRISERAIFHWNDQAAPRATRGRDNP